MKQKATPFSAALTQMIRVEKRCTQEALGKAVGYKQGTISAMMLGDMDGKENKRRLIAEYFAYDYESFLQLGQDLIEKEQTPKTSTKQHRSIKQTEPEPKKEEVVKMDEDVKMMFQRYEKMIESLEQDKKDLRIDLEREHQANDKLNEKNDKLNEKIERIELENKQLLEQYRALKKEKTQSRQSPDKTEEKKAVNQ